MKNVPKLRFKEFNDEWKSELVGNLFSEVRNGFVGTATPYYVEEGVPYLQSNNIRKNRIDTNKMVYITKEFHLKNKKSILKKEDILMVQSGHAGECAVVPSEFEGANCHALIVMTPKKNTNSIYCSYYINSDIGQKKLFKLITGNTVKHILASEIKEFNIKIPKEKEQEKIANFLTKVDKLIEKQEEKVNNLEQYKKGMMQKIFSQEIRFKKDDGGEYPEWEKGKLKKYVNDFIVPMRDKPKVFDGNIPWCRIEDLEGKYLNDTLSGQYVSLEVIKEMNLKVFPKGTLICSCSAKLGVCALTTQNLITNQTFIGLVPGSEVVGEFLYYRMLTYTKKLNSLSSGTTIAYLSRQEFEEFPVKIPCLEEQTKIANFLSKIDSIVEKEKEKLEELRQWKKGLLQQMFV